MTPQKTVLSKSFNPNFLRTLADALEAVTPSIDDIKSIVFKKIQKVKPDGTYDRQAVVKVQRMLQGQQKAGVKVMLADMSGDCDLTLEHREDCPWNLVG